jgi:hypothetical protein
LDCSKSANLSTFLGKRLVLRFAIAAASSCRSQKHGANRSNFASHRRLLGLIRRRRQAQMFAKEIGPTYSQYLLSQHFAHQAIGDHAPRAKKLLDQIVG